MTHEEYVKFMFNEENSHNCESCPENCGFRNNLPCGQQNCWVDVHCNYRKGEEEND